MTVGLVKLALALFALAVIVGLALTVWYYAAAVALDTTRRLTL
jgi:hypothetical protein